jgi:signal transduction histidine kinase
MKEFNMFEFSKRPVIRYGAGLFIAFCVLLLYPGMLQNFFNTYGYEPHGHCYLWEPPLVALFTFTDLLIGLSYVTISFVLAYFVHRTRRDIPFHWVFLAFGAFIIACGGTHFMDIVTQWVPVYWTSGYVRLITALASVCTAIALPPLMPRVFRLIETAKLSEQRRMQLEVANLDLQNEIVERKRAEAALREAHDLLEQRVRERTLDLQTANRDLQTYTYIFSHDLRAPLVNLKGYSSELKDAVRPIQTALSKIEACLDDDEHTTITNNVRDIIPESVQFISSAASRIDVLVNAMLRLSRAGRRELTRESVDMNAVVRSIVDSVAYHIRQHNIQLTVDDLPSVYADRIAMEQIMSNLITNAVNYLDPGRPGEIRIFGERGGVSGKEVTFRVQDNGKGISESDKHKVFEPFRRIGTSNVPGEGLGLAYAQMLVRRHNGRIGFESQQNVGSTFWFTISEIESPVDNALG